MLRPLAVLCAVLAIAACGHRTAAQPSPDSATLGAYVMDATPTGPSPAASPADQPASGQVPGSACSKGQDAFKVLVFLVSSDTGTSVKTISSDLGAGQTLARIAGDQRDLVQQQAIDLVQAWLRFAVANGKATTEQAAWYRTVAQGVISGLMTANVAACVPAVG